MKRGLITFLSAAILFSLSSAFAATATNIEANGPNKGVVGLPNYTNEAFLSPKHLVCDDGKTQMNIYVYATKERHYSVQEYNLLSGDTFIQYIIHNQQTFWVRRKNKKNLSVSISEQDFKNGVIQSPNFALLADQKPNDCQEKIDTP